jgi:LacI family transcriptional regulator
MTDQSIPNVSRSGRHGPTIRDVARLAGVSLGTASKALNGEGRLRQETREKVMQVAREIGYRPNDLAQSLHRMRSRTVGVISSDAFGRFTLPIFQALEEVFADEGVAVFMCNATDDPERERQHVDQLLGKRIDGLVVTARRADRRPPVGPLPAGLPVVYVYSQPEDGSALSLLSDEEAGAGLAVDHLVAIGCTRIAHVTGPERFEAVHQRRNGFHATLERHGLKAEPSHCLAGKWSEEWGREAVAQMFAPGAGAPPDGVFCGNDQIARGVIEAVRERGLSVPDDVAVVGFDNWQVMTDAARPPITSIDMNLADLGREAGRALIAMIGGEAISGLRRLPCTLVQRQSTAR